MPVRPWSRTLGFACAMLAWSSSAPAQDARAVLDARLARVRSAIARFDSALARGDRPAAEAFLRADVVLRTAAGDSVVGPAPVLAQLAGAALAPPGGVRVLHLARPEECADGLRERRVTIEVPRPDGGTPRREAWHVRWVDGPDGPHLVRMLSEDLENRAAEQMPCPSALVIRTAARRVELGVLAAVTYRSVSPSVAELPSGYRDQPFTACNRVECGIPIVGYGPSAIGQNALPMQASLAVRPGGVVWVGAMFMWNAEGGGIVRYDPATQWHAAVTVDWRMQAATLGVEFSRLRVRAGPAVFGGSSTLRTARIGQGARGLDVVDSSRTAPTARFRTTGWLAEAAWQVPVLSWADIEIVAQTFRAGPELPGDRGVTAFRYRLDRSILGVRALVFR